MIKKENVSLILVDTQMPELIGMAARSMLNFDLKNLILVNPRNQDWKEKAEAPACGAFEQVNAQVFDNLKYALSSFQVLFSLTARKRYMTKPSYNLNDVFSQVFSSFQNNNIYLDSLKIGFMFGNEKNGLKNEDIAKSHFIININTNSNFSSMNLAQSVAIVCFALDDFIYQKSIGNIAIANQENLENNLASQEELDYFFDDLFSKLENNNYFSDKTRKEITISNIKNIYFKSKLTTQEVKTLLGLTKLLFGNKK